MDEKLYKLYELMANEGQQFKVSKEQFAQKIRTNPKYRDWAANSAKTIGQDFNSYFTPEEEPKSFNQSIADVVLGDQKPVEAAQPPRDFNAENAEAIKMEQERQKKKPIAQTPNFYEEAKPQLSEFAKTVTEAPTVNPYDPIQKGMAETAAKEKKQADYQKAVADLAYRNQTEAQGNEDYSTEDIFSTAQRMYNAFSNDENWATINEKAKGGQLNEAQTEALRLISEESQKETPLPFMRERKELLKDIAENNTGKLISFVAPKNPEFAKTAYNQLELDKSAKYFNKNPQDISKDERLNYWFGMNQYYQTSKYKDLPENLPSQMLAKDDQNLQQQIERLGTLFPQQELTGEAIEPPKGLSAQFPNPAERMYAYYNILADRYRTLTQQIKSENKGDLSGAFTENSALQGLAMFAPIIGVQDVTNPKIKEWYSVLNKLNAIAPMLREGNIGAADTESKTLSGLIKPLSESIGMTPEETRKEVEAAGEFFGGYKESFLDMYGAPYENATRARVAQEQMKAIADAEINPKTGLTPEASKVLQERMRSGNVDEWATWGGAGGGLTGIMLPFVSANMLGGNYASGKVSKAVSAIDKASDIGKFLFNAEGKLSKSGWLAQKALNMGMTGLQYEYAGLLSGEGEEMRKELRFSQGAIGYAGSQALVGATRSILKGLGNVAGSAAAKSAYLNNAVSAIESQFGKDAAKYVKGYIALVGKNGISEFAEEVSQDFNSNLDEVKNQPLFQKFADAAQKTVNDIAYDELEQRYSLSKVAGYVLPIIAMGSFGGGVDKITGSDEYAFATQLTNLAEQVTGEKATEKDKEIIQDFAESMAQQQQNAPQNFQLTEDGASFELDGKKYVYDAEKDQITGEASEDEKAKAKEVAKTAIDNLNKTLENSQQQAPETPAEAQQEAAQEAPQVETEQAVEQEQPTAEQLDARRAEIETRLPQIEAELQSLSEKPLRDITEDDEILEQVLTGEKAQIEQERDDIVEARKTIKTTQEIQIEQEKQRVDAIEANEARISEIGKEIRQLEITSRTVSEKLAAKRKIEALESEKSALVQEIEALQPKEIVEDIAPASEQLEPTENLQVSESVTETPIEQPITETPIEQGSSKMEQTEMIVPQAEKANFVDENLQNMTTLGESVTETPEIAKQEGQRLVEMPKNENEVIEKEETTETPVAPAAPQEQKPAPQRTEKKPERKGRLGIKKPKTEPNQPKQETRKVKDKQGFSDFIYEMSDKTPEDKAKAEYTAQIYEEAAKAWAKNTGKSVKDWWDRIESITIGGEGEMGFERLNQDLPIKKIRTFKTKEGTFDLYDIEDAPKGRAEMFTVLKDKKGWIVRNVIIPDSMQRKGVATNFYKKINSESIKATGKPLRSTPKRKLISGESVHEISDAGVSLWDSFVKRGLATKLSDKNYVFSDNALNQGEMGSVQKTAENTFKVFLLTNRDVSTPLHELAHIFQNDLSEAQKETAVKWINDTYNKNFSASQWVWEGGTDKSLTPESREISEFFAKGFEQYLKEGRKVSDKKMQSIFDSFAEWLKEVYQTAIEYFGADIVLNDDMRSLYDTMLGQDKEFAQKVKNQSKLQKLIDEDATNPEQLVWNYFAKGGQINTQDVVDRFKAAKRGKPPINAAYTSDKAKTKQQIAKDLYDSQVGEKQFDESDFFGAIDAVVDEIGTGFSKTVEAKMKEYAATKNQNQDEEAINTEAEALIEEERRNRANKPSKDELLRMQYQNEIDEAIFGGNSLYQDGSGYSEFIREWQAYIDDIVDIEQARDDIDQEIQDLLAEMEDVSDRYISTEKKLEIVNTAISKVLNPPTEAEKRLSDHFEKTQAEAERVRKIEQQSLPQADIDNLRDIARGKAESITDSTTQEERIEMRDALIEDFVSKGMTQEAAKELVGQYIREMSFGRKFRDKYAPQMSKDLRDAVVDKTYYYGVVSNESAILKAQGLINDWYENAIEQTAEKWGDKADANDADFIADTYESLMDIIDRQLFDSKVTNDYYVKVAAALTATRLADTLIASLKGNAKARMLDKLVSLVDKLAALGNQFGKTINMFGVMANVKGGVLQAIFKKEMAAIISNMSEAQKTAKDAIESVINGVSEMVEGIANGKDKELLQSLAESMQNIPAIDRLLNKIIENVTSEQDVIDILDKIDDLEVQKEVLIKQIKDKKVLEEKIREKNKEIASLKGKLAQKPAGERVVSAATNAKKSAAKAKYESLIKDVVSFGKTLFDNNLYQRTKIKGFESTLLDTYKENVINKVNDIMKNITDYVYLGNENVSPDKLYKMIQETARTEFAQKYLEKAEVQPEIPINTNANLNKTEEAKNEAARKKNAEKAAQRRLHADILDAINNDKFKASIEAYLQENREKDIRNQMRKRVVGIVNNTEITEKVKKVQLRKALAQMVAEAATSANESAKGVKDFMQTYFDISGKDVTAFEQEFDKLWEAQVKKKQQELIKKRLRTNEEREQKLNDKAINELIKGLEKDKEFGHEFMSDLAKNIRITQGNWEENTAKRFREYYHIPVLTDANQKKIANMIKYVDSLPNDTDAKTQAMDTIMTEYLNIVGIENIDKWVSLIDVMFHVNNLLNLATQWQNVKDSFQQVIHDLSLPLANFFGEIITAMRDRKPFLEAIKIAQKANAINAAVVWKTLFSQSTYRLIANQFSVKEARAVGEYSSFMDYFAKSFAELPKNLRRFKIKSVSDFIQYGIPAVLMTIYDTLPLSTVSSALLSAPDLALGNALQMGRMANILSRKGIASQEAIDLADISKAGSRKMEYGGYIQSINEILADERSKGYFANQEKILEVWNNAIGSGKTEAQAHGEIEEAIRSGEIESDYKKEWRRKMQLFGEYIEQDYAAWIIADTYRKNATYKNDPTGLLGGLYDWLNTSLVRDLRKKEIDAREAYKRNKTASNLAWQKGWQFLKIVAERMAGTAYLRTKINIYSKRLANMLVGSIIRAVKNYVPYMDTEAAMRKAIDKEGKLKPNSLWYIDDLAHKGFLGDAAKKIRSDIDDIETTATKNKENITKRETSQIEKIDKQISDKEKTLSEKIESTEKLSQKKQDSIDRKIDKRKEILSNYSEKVATINTAFAEKRKKILATADAKTEGLKNKMYDLLTTEMRLVEAAYNKKESVENKIREYTDKWEKLSVDIMLISKKVESEKEAFEESIAKLKLQVADIAERLNESDKSALIEFATQKEKGASELYEKRAKPSMLSLEKMLAEKEKTEMQFNELLKQYKTKHENSAETIRKGIDNTLKQIEKNIESLAKEKDIKIQENTKAQNEAIQKVADIVSSRIAALDRELDVAINVEKEKYDRHKKHLQNVFDAEKAKLEKEKKIISDRAQAERDNIDDLAKTKSAPLRRDIYKIRNKIDSYTESYKIGIADEAARRFRILGVNAIITYSAARFLMSILGGDDEDEEPIIEVVGDIIPQKDGTKAQNQNQEEANSKLKIIFRALGKQMSFNFSSLPMINDLLAWGEVFDHLRERKRGVISDKSAVDVVSRPILTSFQQVFAFRDMETLNFADPFVEPSERAVRIAANLSPVKMPSQIRQFVSDVYYKGRGYDRPEDETYFQQYLRLIGAHPEWISTKDSKYAEEYSMIDGQPIYRYAGDNVNEINRLISTRIWGKETATSFNDFTVKPDRLHVLYKEMEFKKWLFDTGITRAINITNPAETVPVMAEGVLLGTKPLPKDEFQEKVVKPTAEKASDKLRKMYKSKKFDGKTEAQIIKSVKEMSAGEDAAKDFLKSDRTNRAALNIGLKYIAKDLWEETKKEVLGEYLEKKPEYKQLGESLSDYKKRIEKKLTSK